MEQAIENEYSVKKDWKRIAPGLTTYIIVMIVLLAGIFLPWFTRDAEGENVMMLQLIPDAINKALNIESVTWSGTFFVSGASIFSAAPFALDMNIIAWAILLYCVVTFFGLIAFIPIGVVTHKREEELYREKLEPAGVTGWMYVFETLALLVMTLYIFSKYYICEYIFDGSKLVDVDILMIAVYAVTWICFIIQCIYYKSKSNSGVIKTILSLLSIIALAMTLFCEFSAANGSTIGVTFSGVDSLAESLHGTVGFVDGKSGFDLIEVVFRLNEGPSDKLIYYFAFATLALIMFNYVLDTMNLGIRARKSGKIFGIVRYALELVAAIVTCVIIAAKTGTGVEMGIVIYGIIIIALIQTIISISRMFVKDSEPVAKATKPNTHVHSTPQNVTVYKNPEAPVSPDSGFYDVASVISNPPPVYTRVYAYEDDAFIRTLTPAERSEFYALFIDKVKGNFYYLPDYVLGQENREFFQEIFIHLGNVMSVMSPQLLNKIYAGIQKTD